MAGFHPLFRRFTTLLRGCFIRCYGDLLGCCWKTPPVVAGLITPAVAGLITPSCCGGSSAVAGLSSVVAGLSPVVAVQ